MKITGTIRSIGLALVGLGCLTSSGLAVEAAAISALHVRSGPGTSFMVVDTLYAGEIVDVVECNAAGNLVPYHAYRS